MLCQQPSSNATLGKLSLNSLQNTYIVFFSSSYIGGTWQHGGPGAVHFCGSFNSLNGRGGHRDSNQHLFGAVAVCPSEVRTAVAASSAHQRWDEQQRANGQAASLLLQKTIRNQIKDLIVLIIGSWTPLAVPWWWLGVQQPQQAAARTSSKQQHTIPTPADPLDLLCCAVSTPLTPKGAPPMIWTRCLAPGARRCLWWATSWSACAPTSIGSSSSE